MTLQNIFAQKSMLDECINNLSAKFSGVMVRSVNHNHKKKGGRKQKGTLYNK